MGVHTERSATDLDRLHAVQGNKKAPHGGSSRSWTPTMKPTKVAYHQHHRRQEHHRELPA
eukprot:6103466-Amphidinium_carterae.1